MDSKQIWFLGFDGVAASHIILPAETFSTATLDVGYGNPIPCYRISIVGPKDDAVLSDCGIRFDPTAALETAPEIDTLVVPGGKGLRNSATVQKLSEWILTRADSIRRIAVVSNGIYAVAPTGLLDGREVTVDPDRAVDLRRQFPELRVDSKRRVVKDGAFHTSSSVGAAIDLSLALIEQDYGGKSPLRQRTW